MTLSDKAKEAKYIKPGPVIRVPESSKADINPPPTAPLKPEPQPIREDKIYLHDIVEGITLASLNTKVRIDKYVSQIRSELKKDELLKDLPITTFDISELETDLKLLVNNVEKKNGEKLVVIDTDIEKLKQVTPDMISTIRFKIVSRRFTEYDVEGEKVLKET